MRLPSRHAPRESPIQGAEAGHRHPPERHPDRHPARHEHDGLPLVCQPAGTVGGGMAPTAPTCRTDPATLLESGRILRRVIRFFSRFSTVKR